MDQNETGAKTMQWTVGIIIVAIILIIAGYFIFRSPATEESTETNTPVTQTPTKAMNRILVTDQFPGDKVYISTVELIKPGFVVIHKNNAGAPGKVIGYQWFDKGTGAGSVTLTEKMIDQGVYFAVLHDDVNSDKKFVEATDQPLLNASGDVIMVKFKALMDLPEVKG